jgi:hypothetical protein
MVVDERSRHELYRRLEEVLGAEAATTLIEHLPPVGWADVATKHDLASLEERMDLRFARVDERFNAVDTRFDMVDTRFDRVDERFKMIDQRFVDLDTRFTAVVQGSAAELRAAFEHELRAQITTVMFGIIGVVLTMAALAFALVRFT